jgi:hypothetical protein
MNSFIIIKFLAALDCFLKLFTLVSFNNFEMISSECVEQRWQRKQQEIEIWQ